MTHGSALGRRRRTVLDAPSVIHVEYVDALVVYGVESGSKGEGEGGSQMGRSTWGRTLAALAMVAGVLSAVPQGLAAQPESEPVEAWVHREIYTSEFGVARPVGLTVDAAAGVFYVMDDDRRTLVGITPFEDLTGEIAVPDAADPLNVTLDAASRRVLSFGEGALKARNVGAATSSVVARPGIDSARGITADAETGDVFVLDATRPRIFRIGDAGVEARITIRELADRELRGVAYNPQNDLLYVASPTEQALYEIDQSGSVLTTFDLSAAELVDPQAITFVPTTDNTDDPNEMSLLVADIDGRIVEMSLTEQVQAVAAADTAILVSTTLLSNLNPPSPDSAGITYLSNRDRLLVSDSEVNEMSIFQGVNLWELERNGTQRTTGVTEPWSNEPTGASWNENNNHLYVSDDTGTRGVYDVDPGGDGFYGTGDDSVTQFDLGAFGASDPEGVAYDPLTGDIFIIVGAAREVYQVDPGPDGLFNNIGDTIVNNFDVRTYGANDPEGIAYNPFANTLLVLDHSSQMVYEVDKAGALIRTIDISAANGDKEAGIVLAPASNGSSGWNMYIVDRGVDNGADPNENDGRLFELMVDFGPPPGDPPVALDDSATTPEDVPVIVNVVDNDTDPDGNLDPNSAAPNSSPANGTAVGNGNGTITYTPDPNFAGSDSFTYQVCDLTFLCSSATVSITVTQGDDDPPVAVDDTASTPADTPVVIDVVANDSDPDGNLNPSSAAPTAQPANGSATGNNNGTITYTPNPSFAGQDSFTYQVCDLTALCATAQVSVTVGASGLVYYVSFSSTTSVPGISGSVRDEDIVTYDAADDVWAMYFDASDVGLTSSDLDAFHVRANGTVLMSFSSDGTVIPGMTGGPEGELVDESDVFLFTPTSVGDTTAGTFTFYFDGSDVDLTSSGEDVDGLHEFADGSLGISTTGNVTVGVLPSGGDEDVHRFTGTFGAATSGTWSLDFDGSDVGLTASGDDLDGVAFDNDTDMVFSTSGTYSAAGGSGDNEDVSRFVGTFGGATSGTASLEQDLSALGIDPAADVDAVSLAGTVVDPPSGDPPVAVDDSATTIEDQFVTVDVASNDSDPDGNLDPTTAAPTSLPASGSAVGNGDGTITYTPNPNFAGSDSFTYQICDLTGLCSFANVSITVTPGDDDPPVAVDDTASTPAETAVTIDVVANDSDPDDNLDPTSAAPTSIPSDGSAVGNGDGTITYTPDTGFSGSDGFSYEVCDLTGLCASAQVTVVVAGAGGSVYYMSFASTTPVPGIASSVRDEDIVSFDPATGTWAMFFDASDVGLTSSDLDAFYVRPSGSVLMSFSSDGTVIPGMTGGPNGELVDESDVFLFTPTSVGDTTAGSFSFYFDGDDVDLSTNGEDVDGLHEFADGSLAISTSGSNSVGGLPSGGDEDVYRFTGTFGSVTAGTWALYFDGSEVGFTASAADINAITFDAETDMLFSTAGTFTAAGTSGDDEDISRFAGTFGETTSGTASLELDLSALGIPTTADVDALSFGAAINLGP